ncbi:MAG TPA: hypothetical protein PKC72_09010 [Chitinophagaceae bacterium]|nr:hypothetical protein [Chitinophagaceae bacterium]
MKNDFNQVVVAFNNSASKLFSILFQKFENSAASVDRRRNENSFQQLQGKFIYTFKLQLENIAQQLLEENLSLNDSGRLKQKLTEAIRNYLDEFMRKAKSL